MTQPRRRETPEFLFERRPDVEANHDWLLAGILTIDAPRKPLPPAKRHQRQVNAILKELIDAAQDDSLPAGGLDNRLACARARWRSKCDAAEFDDGATSGMARALANLPGARHLGRRWPLARRGPNSP